MFVGRGKQGPVGRWRWSSLVSSEVLVRTRRTRPAAPSDLEERSAALEVACSDHDGVRVTTGSTGRIEISDFFVSGTFYADDTILRTERCVAHLEGPDEPRAPAGTLTVSSDLVGTPGGPPVPLVVNPDPSNDYFEFPDPPLFNYPDGTRVQIQLAGAPGFPAIHHRNVRSSPFGVIAFAQPQVPASGVLFDCQHRTFRVRLGSSRRGEAGAAAEHRCLAVGARARGLGTHLLFVAGGRGARRDPRRDAG